MLTKNNNKKDTCLLPHRSRANKTNKFKAKQSIMGLLALLDLNCINNYMPEILLQHIIASNFLLVLNLY